MTKIIGRRGFLIGGWVLLDACSVALRLGEPRLRLDAEEEDVALADIRSDEAWRRRLEDRQFVVLRRHGTEEAKSSSLNEERRRGTYVCAACGLDLFSSSTKYEHFTGWPSFWEPIPQSTYETVEPGGLLKRTGVHCANCGGHLGFVFDNGLLPSGLRYSINGVALRFIPDANGSVGHQ